jgi:hypothetical protein
VSQEHEDAKFRESMRQLEAAQSGNVLTLHNIKSKKVKKQAEVQDACADENSPDLGYTPTPDPNPPKKPKVAIERKVGTSWQPVSVHNTVEIAQDQMAKYTRATPQVEYRFKVLA